MLYRFGFYLLIVTSPLFLGSNRPLFWGINGVLSALILMGFVWFESREEPSRLDWRLPFIAIFCFLLIGIWIAVQALPWTPRAWHHPVWFASPMLAKAKSAISANPSQTWQTLGWWSTLSVFVVAVRLGTNTRQRILVLNTMLSVCSLVALFGFIVEFFGLNTLGLIPKTHYRGWLTGTFVNRNSAASFIGIGLVIALALARHAYFDPRNQYTTFSLPSICRLFVSRVGFYASVGAALFCAVLMTGSRGGILTGIIGGSLVLLMCLRRGGTPRAPAIAMLLGGVAISIALSVSALKNRTDASESTSVRLSLYGEALRAIADRPILGHGAGTYSSIQPIYHSASTPSNFIWDNVHSTVLEAALTLGIPAIIFGTGVLVYILLQLFDTWRNTSTEAICILVILAVSVAVALHAFVDFSLEIQAIALYVACLLGLGMGEKMSIDANRTIRDDSSTQLGAPPVCSPA